MGGTRHSSLAWSMYQGTMCVKAADTLWVIAPELSVCPEKEDDLKELLIRYTKSKRMHPGVYNDKKQHHGKWDRAASNTIGEEVAVTDHAQAKEPIEWLMQIWMATQSMQHSAATGDLANTLLQSIAESPVGKQALAELDCPVVQPTRNLSPAEWRACIDLWYARQGMTSEPAIVVVNATSNSTGEQHTEMVSMGVLPVISPLAEQTNPTTMSTSVIPSHARGATGTTNLISTTMFTCPGVDCPKPSIGASG